MSNLSEPETWWTVIPNFKPTTEVGPFTTYEEARKFASIRCMMQAHIHEYRQMRLVSSKEVTREEYDKSKREPGYLTNPAEF